MELRHLRYFIRAAELLNFTKAAESLYVSQPTLSVQIHQLEQELGAELFARVGRNVRLTQAGEVFLTRARQAVQELEEGAKEVDALSGLLRGTLSIASLPLIGSKLIPDWVILYKERYPNVRVHARSSTSEDIEGRIIGGSVDLGLATAPIHPELSWEKLFADETVLLVAHSHPLAAKTMLDVDDLRDLPLAVPSERITSSQAIAKYFEGHGIDPKIEMTYDDGHALLEVVKKGKMATCLPRWAALGESQVRAISLPPPGMRIQVGAVWLHLSPAAKAFLELIREEIEKLPVGARA